MDSTDALYVVQWAANPNLCLGVASAAINAPVVLSLLGGADDPLTHWLLNASIGSITLEGSPDPENPLCLDVAGKAPEPGSTLLLTVANSARSSQAWDWTSDPPQLVNLAAPGLCATSANGLSIPGNPIEVVACGGADPGWQFLTLQELLARLAAAEPSPA